MIARYARTIMKDLWSDAHKFETYLKVELAASHAWMTRGLFSESEYQKLSKGTFRLEDIERIEAEVRHDVIAFTKAVGLSLGPEKKWFHYSLTSTDVVDTAQSMILKEANHIILDDLNHFMEILKTLAFRYKKTPSMGRTHGMHAEVTSFGLKFALWYEDMKRIRKTFIDACSDIEVIKMSGAVGTFSGSHPDIQTHVAERLGLRLSKISTQTLQRDRHAKYMSALALIASELEKIAVEIRHLSRTEVGEVAESFKEGQKGSSAMPHKKNPVSSENISGLSRVIRGYMMSSFENIALWHERDISHSSVERIILSDATILIDYMLDRYANTLETLDIHTDRMMENIGLTHGVVFAQGVLNHLIQRGLDRQEAYDRIQGLAMKALTERCSFKALVEEDSELSPYLEKDAYEAIFNPMRSLEHVDLLFQNVFGK